MFRHQKYEKITNDPCNPTIAEAMKALEYVSRYIRGVFENKKDSWDNENQEVQLSIDNNSFGVKVNNETVIANNQLRISFASQTDS